MNTNFYRGYIKLKENKEPYDNRRMHRHMITDWPTVGGVFRHEYMMVDTDTDEDSNLLLLLIDKYKWKAHVVVTDSGLHAIFKKPDMPVGSITKTELMCGIRADFKVGRRDYRSSDYECVIKHGKCREVLQQCDDPQVLPWQLMPFTVEMDLKSACDGSNRHGIHQQLVARSTAYTLDENEIYDFVVWINDNVFDEPRESVNWKPRQIEKWIKTHVAKDVPKTPEDMIEFLKQYKITDYTKIMTFVMSNYDLREDK